MLPFTLLLFNMHLWDTVLGPGGRDPNSFFVSEVLFFFFFFFKCSCFSSSDSTEQILHFLLNNHL